MAVKTGTGNKGTHGGKTLNFGTGGLLSGKTLGADEVTFAKGIGEVLKKAPVPVGVHIFSTNSFKELAYTSIVISMVNNETLIYYTILLEASGRHDMTSDTYLDMIKDQQRPFVTTDAIDAEFHKIIQTELLNQNKEIKNTISMEGIVVPAGTELENEALVQQIAADAYNACSFEMSIITDTNSVDDIKLN